MARRQFLLGALGLAVAPYGFCALARIRRIEADQVRLPHAYEVEMHRLALVAAWQDATSVEAWASLAEFAWLDGMCHPRRMEGCFEDLALAALSLERLGASDEARNSWVDAMQYGQGKPWFSEFERRHHLAERLEGSLRRQAPKQS